MTLGYVNGVKDSHVCIGASCQPECVPSLGTRPHLEPRKARAGVPVFALISRYPRVPLPPLSGGLPAWDLVLSLLLPPLACGGRLQPGRWVPAMA